MVTGMPRARMNVWSSAHGSGIEQFAHGADHRFQGNWLAEKSFTDQKCASTQLNRPQRGQVNDGEARPRLLHRSSDLKARHVFAVPVHARDHDQRHIFPMRRQGRLLIRGDGDGDTFVVQPSASTAPASSSRSTINTFMET
jgi:hypothetical protein